MEQTLILVKPDGVRRKLVGEVVSRIERKGLDIGQMHLMDVSREKAEEHYAEHRDKSFYEELVSFITSTPVVAMRVEGEGAIAQMRGLMGATNPAEAAPGTIRGDLALSITENLVHGSDSPESAERELALFFDRDRPRLRFILASESARRVELLRRAGYDFEARRSGFPEVGYDDPAATVEENARGKALAVAREEPGSVVLASDTVVYLPGAGVFGQAADAGEVRRMLDEISGREHEVHTGVAVAAPGMEPEVRREVTRVRLREVSEGERDAYAADGEGVGKAGGYAIQGLAAIFVERIEGDYTSVVGLPLSLTAGMLAERGVRWYG